MRRIDSDTREQDKFGTGKDGFTDGNAGLMLPPTHLNADWFDAAQEEIARAIESRGIALDEASFVQLRRVIDTSLAGIVLRSRVGTQNGDGLVYGSFSGFDASLTPGTFWYEGRRYDVTQEQIDALGTESPRTFPADTNTLVALRPVDGDTANDDIEVATATDPDDLLDYTIVALVITGGAGVIATSADIQTGPHVQGLSVGTHGVAPRVPPGSNPFPTLGIDAVHQGSDDNRPMYFAQACAHQVRRRPAGGTVNSGRVLDLVFEQTIVDDNTAQHVTILSTPPSNSSGVIIVETIGHRTNSDALPWGQLRTTYYRRTAGGTLSVDVGTDSPAPIAVTASSAATVTVTVSGSSVRVTTQLASAVETWKFTHNVRIVQSAT